MLESRVVDLLKVDRSPSEESFQLPPTVNASELDTGISLVLIRINPPV